MSALLLIFLVFSLKFDCTFGNIVVSNSNISCLECERKALYEFKKSLVDESNLLSSWTGDDCCTWHGVGCSTRTRHVTKLDLRNPVILSDTFSDDDFKNYSRHCLKGEINSFLIDLKYLSYLDLSQNNFSGSQIPQFIGSLTNLRYLNLSFSYFSGRVPHHLGNLSLLHYLDLHQYFTVSDDGLEVDSLWWLSKLSSLKYLDLAEIDLSKARDWFSSVNMLPSLLVLNLGSCGLETIPLHGHVNFTSLTSLDLSNNNLLTGDPVPQWLSNITALMNLHLQWNFYHGPIPELIGHMTSLTFLDLSFNSFDSFLPNSLSRLHNLVHLDLSFNDFHGLVPMQVLNNHTQLRTLDLSYNKFHGLVPSDMSNLGQLENFFLSENKFQGPIPVEISNLTQLISLDLRDNKFRGEIPVEMGNLTQLRNLDLHDNELTGNLPDSFQKLGLLKKLDVSHNKLNGTISESIAQLLELEKLNLFENSMSGTISENHLGNLTMLKELILSSNSDIVLNFSSKWVAPFQLQLIRLVSCKVGPQLPNWLQHQTHIEELVISNGSISGAIPKWFKKIYSRVTRLDLSHNQITGEWSDYEFNSSVVDLDLSHNQITGKITSFPPNLEVFDLSNNMLSGLMFVDDNIHNFVLEGFFISNNRITGDVPSFLCNIKTLKFIVLSENQFFGQLPSCLGSLEKLERLDVTNNNLSGLIPTSLGNLTSLTSLHLHNNKFHGNIPASFRYLTNLVTLDLGVNDIIDVIPPWIGENLSKLRFLSLQSNKLGGMIPTQLCYLSDLQLLNLAQNNINGSIPCCFGNLSAMVRNHSADEYYAVSIDFTVYGFQGEKILDSMKGIELEFSTSLPFLVSIDLADNDIDGDIPKELMDLMGLRNLNLAGNHIEGNIPEKIGSLRELVSLDLSRNTLHGPIPQSLSNLSFLSHLNLSFNDLSGRIPTGNQLQTLNDPSIYIGNQELCGTPSLKKCSTDDRYHDPKYVQGGEKEDDDDNHMWFYTGMAPGFLVGFLGFCGTLHFNKTWRYAYFQFFKKVGNLLAVKILLKMTWLRQKFRKHG